MWKVSHVMHNSTKYFQTVLIQIYNYIYFYLLCQYLTVSIKLNRIPQVSLVAGELAEQKVDKFYSEFLCCGVSSITLI